MNDTPHSADRAGAGAPGAEDARAGGRPSEEELRAAYEAELSRVSSADVVLQTVVSLLNLGGRRLGLSGGPAGEPAGERDLEQVRDAIDGVRGLMGVLERRMPRELTPLRDALAQLQMAYAREASAKPPREPAGKPSETPAAQEAKGPGPAESSGRLWVPGR